MIRALALLALVAGASAMDCWSLDPALHRDDRQQHAAGGLVIGAVTVAALNVIPATRDIAPWQQVAIGTIAALVVGVGKELIDAHDRDDHCTELGDIAATGIGGAGGALAVTLVWHF